MSLKELTILGCGPTHVECKYNTEEIWGVNGTYTFAKRLSKLFITDGPDQAIDDVPGAGKIRKLGCPLILASRFPGIAEQFEKAGVKVEVFPINEVMQKFPTKFYSNSLAYMMAYALLHNVSVQEPGDPLPHVIDGYNKIYFYGIDMMTNSSYLVEKGGVEFWMGVAMGLGVEVINTRGSATGKTWNGKMYGWWGDPDHGSEKLLAPWEMIPGNKEPTNEWVKKGQDWVKLQ